MNKNEWETPDWLFERYNGIYHFEIDAAANSINHKLDKWFGPDSPLGVYDALNVNWRDYGSSFWLNPPYGRGLMEPFIAKAINTWQDSFTEPYKPIHIVMLLPVDTSTKWWHKYIQPYLDERMERGHGWDNKITDFQIEFLPRRVRFVGAKESPRFASCIVEL